MNLCFHNLHVACPAQPHCWCYCHDCATPQQSTDHHLHPELLHAEQQEFHGLQYYSGLHLLWKLQNNFHVLWLLLCYCTSDREMLNVFLLLYLIPASMENRSELWAHLCFFNIPNQMEIWTLTDKKPVQRSEEIFSKNCQLKGLRYEEDVEVWGHVHIAIINSNTYWKMRDVLNVWNTD